jgi:uncharacterized MAPEG superfamily protein
MPESLMPYGSSLAAWIVVGGAYLVQTLVADLAMVRARHTPGMPIASGHGDFLFRASRAHANTNESLAAFVVLSLAAMLLGASPAWTNGFGWGFALARVGHMLAYYADQRLFRSVAFAVGFACLLGLLIVGLIPLVA